MAETTAALARRRAEIARQTVQDAAPAPQLRAWDLPAEANPGKLQMFSYAPADLAAGAPLVVLLHGCGQSAAAFAAGAGWLTLADRHGFALLCPEQASANNANRCFNWFLPDHSRRGRGEAASIRAMITLIQPALKLDASRIFITGLSAGGAMSAAMIAAYPETFAGAAIVAGLPYGVAGNAMEALGAMFWGRPASDANLSEAVRKASNHTGPWPRLSIWHGDSDSVVAPANADLLVQQWSALLVPTGAAVTMEELPGRRRKRWPSPDGRPALEFNLVTDFKHGMPIAATGPDGIGAAGPYVLEAGLSASREILDFWELPPERPAAAPHRKPVRQPAPAEPALPVAALLAAETAEQAAPPKRAGLWGRLRRGIARLFGRR